MGSDDLTPSSHIDKLKQITERMLSFDQMLQTEAQSRNSRLDDVSKVSKSFLLEPMNRNTTYALMLCRNWRKALMPLFSVNPI